MDSEDSIRQKKQHFLYTQIIESGYDPTDFKEFLDNKKENGGSNVDVWEFDELKKLTNDYRLIKEKNNFEKYEDIQLDPPMKSSEIIEEKKEELSEITKEEKEKENFSKILNCLLLDESPLYDSKNINITISEVKVIPGSIFTSAYALFTIEVKSLGWEVKRRYSDFFNLRNFLHTIFPGILIPPIPSKKVTRSLSEIYLNKRKIFLEKFLKDCLENPTIRNYKAFVDFLSVKNELSTRSLLHPKKVEKIEDLRAMDGKVELKINDEIKNYIQKISEFTTNSEQLYYRIKKLHNKLVLDLDQVSSTLFEIGNTFTALNEINTNFNLNVGNDKNHIILGDIYVSLNNMYIKWGDTTAKQIKLAKENLCSFFKYERKFANSIKEIIKTRNFHCNEYYRTKYKLEQKKQYDLSKENKKFSLDEPNLDQLKDWFAFFNNTIANEIKRSYSDKCKKYIKNFVNFGNLQTNIITENHFIWVEIISHFNELESDLKKK